jgi:predicted Zn-dependent protease
MRINMTAHVGPNRFDRCNNCGVTLSSETSLCPACGAPASESKSRHSIVKRVVSWRHFRHLLIALILLLLPHVPHINKIFPYRLLLPTSPLVLEAVTRANQHPGTGALLGRPVSAGWLSRGYVWSDETGWSEGKMWIPVSGVKGNGMLHARGGQADSPWVFSELRLIHDDGRVLDLLLPVAQTSLVPLPKQVRIYIVPMGHVQGLGLDELPAFYRNQYGLAVELLEPVSLEPTARNSARGQLIFGELIELLHRRLPNLAKDKSAFLIGVTDEDMYIRGNNSNFAYTAYDPPQRVGVVSSHRFIPYPLAGQENLLRSRIRKMVSRTIGFVVFNLPWSNDPSSVMYKDLYGAASADLMSDRFEGLGVRAVVDEFKSAHGMPAQPAEMLPDAAKFDYSKVDGRHPCLRISKTQETAPGGLDVALTKCERGVYLDQELDEIEVDLRGNLITRTTDLFVPGALALSTTRCYRAWDSHSRTFGQNTAFSWDLFPVGSRQPYTYMEIIPCDGNGLRFERISKGTGYADAVYEHRTTNTAFLGSRITWNGNGWDLKLRDGSLYLFPDSYYGKRSADGALSGFRNAEGSTVKIERPNRRNLKKISTAEHRWIAFEYDMADRIITAEDYLKRKVDYLYDHGGRLAEVRGLKSTTRYFYDNRHLIAVEENGRRTAEFAYEDGRVSRLTLPDRGSYRLRYEYDPAETERVLRSVVTAPDGSLSKFDLPTN